MMGLIYRILLTGLFICTMHLLSMGQPIYNTGQEIEGVLVYQDLLLSNKYYYAPSNLELAINADGSPKFKYLKMANSLFNKDGTGAQLKDLNLIQLSLIKPTISSEKLQQIKNRIGGKTELKLVPMPIDKMEFVLFAGIESSGKSNVLGNHLNTSAEPNHSGIWEEKSLTIRLSKAGAAFLDKQLEDFGQPGIYYSYSYFADFVIGMDELEITENNMLALPEMDTTIHKIAYQANFFELKIDFEKWGDKCLEEVILNEALLPKYLPIQVFCYDFSDDLRPDLFLKKVEVCGDGLEGVESCVQLDFSNQQRDKNAYSLRFKRPVLMTKPLRYKVIEISKVSGLQQGEWIAVQPGESINITTSEQNQPYDNHVIEIQADFEEMKALGFQKAKIELSYQVNQRKKQKDISIHLNEDHHFFTTNLFYDKGSAINYTISWIGDNGAAKVENSKILDGDYIYLKP